MGLVIKALLQSFAIATFPSLFLLCYCGKISAPLPTRPNSNMDRPSCCQTLVEPWAQHESITVYSLRHPCLDGYPSFRRSGQHSTPA